MPGTALPLGADLDHADQRMQEGKTGYAVQKGETIASLPGFGMAPEGHLSYSSGPNMRARRIKPCSVRVRIDPIPLKGLPRLQTCHRQRSSHTGAPTRDKRVHGVGTRPIGTSSSADAARLGESRPVVSAGSRGHVFAALLYEVS